MKFKISILVILLVLESLGTGLIPHSKGYMFTLLDNKSDLIYWGAALYFFNYMSIDIFQSFKIYTVTKVSLIYRDLRSKTFLSNSLKPISNATQRVQEDIKLSYQNRIQVWCEYFISSLIVIQLLAINYHYPLLVLAALGYSVLSVIVAIRFNPRLTKAEVTVQQEEANFRSNLNLKNLLFTNKVNLKAATVRLQYALFSRFQLAILNVLPIIVLAPYVLNGSMSLGDLIMHQSTFSLIVVNASILIQLYPLFIQGKASESRVKELE